MLKVDEILPVARQRLATISVSNLLIDAAKLLNGSRFNLVVVCDVTGKMVGVISKTDIVDRISYCTGCNCTMAITQAMTKDVVSCQPTDLVNDLWSIIRGQGLKNIPVVDHDIRPVGILTARDILLALLAEVENERENEEKLFRDYLACDGYR